MAEIIGDVILQSQAAKEQTQFYNFATVGAVYDDGLSLIFDGQENATEKHYKCNTSVAFKAGDRVKIMQDSGTYVVEYVVGAPKKTSGAQIPAGGSSGLALVKASADDYDTTWARPVNVVSIQNQWATNQAYAIQFRTTNLSGSATFQVRFGGGAWRTITTT